MEFVCKVGTPAGEVMERTFVATSESALRTELEQQGFYLFQVKRGLLAGGLATRRKRVPRPALMAFGQELAALLKAGLPLVQSLDVMLDRQRDPIFKQSLTTVRDKLKSGTALSDAFAAEGELYPPIFPASLIAGERSGNLETVLRRFVQYLRLNETLKRKAISSAIYPLVLLTMMIALAAIFMIFVVPRFQGFYEGLDAKLPLLTRVMLTVGNFLSANLFWITLVVGAGVAWLMAWYRRDGSGLVIDRLLLRVPYVGNLMRMYASSQLARTLSTLLAGGLPLLNALETAASSIGNRAMAASVAAATPLIREGKSLTAALESTGMLDALTLEMVKVGEQTGALGDMLDAVAEFYDEELDARIGRTLALVEPIMLVLMAVVVAVMLLAFYLPLFEAITVIQTRGT